MNIHSAYSEGLQCTGGSPEVACYVINLARDRERFESVSARLMALDIAFVRHPAVNGKRHSQLIERSFRRRYFSRAKGRRLTDGEIGCALSHLTVYRRMLREGVQKALILEDDAMFAPEFSAFFKQNLNALLNRFDVIKIEGIFFDHCSTDAAVLTKAGAVDLVLPLRPTLGSAAYAVTRRGAERLFRACAAMDDPLDVLLVQYERHGAPYAEARPMLVKQADSESVLEAERVSAERELAAISFIESLHNRRRFATRVLMRLLTWVVWTSRARIGGRALIRR